MKGLCADKEGLELFERLYQNDIRYREEKLKGSNKLISHKTSASLMKEGSDAIKLLAKEMFGASDEQADWAASLLLSGDKVAFDAYAASHSEAQPLIEQQQAMMVALVAALAEFVE